MSEQRESITYRCSVRSFGSVPNVLFGKTLTKW